MKNLIIMAACLVANICASQTTKAQTYEPSNAWPYAEADFASGTIVYSDGRKFDGVYNIHLANCNVHRLDGDKVEAVEINKPAKVHIGDNDFIQIDGEFARVLGQNEKAFVVKKVNIDFNKLSSGSGAYGSTLNTSGRLELSSYDLGGINLKSHGQMRQNRANSSALPLIEKRYVIFNGTTVPARERAIRDLLPEDRQKEWKEACKKAKIKWNDDKSVGRVADLLKDF